jgi:CheY-like chemotaxis protein
MRKVLEITFTGSDLQVTTASSFDAALQKLKSDRPDVVIADVTLEPKNGYELCKAIKQASPSTAVLILSSKQNPFDVAKGSAAQADDHMDKPFDTTQMIDKVRKLLAARGEAGAGAQPAAAAAQPAAAAPAAAAPTGRPVAGQTGRAKTLIYNQPVTPPPAATPPAAVAPAPIVAPAAAAAAAPRAAASPPAKAAQPERFAPTPVTGIPLQSKPSAPEPAPVPGAVAAGAAAHMNGHMASKLEGLGLTPAQVEAVLALSREVVERVVWEVVPVLAETIIKEEIARLTK